MEFKTIKGKNTEKELEALKKVLIKKNIITELEIKSEKDKK